MREGHHSRNGLFCRYSLDPVAKAVHNTGDAGLLRLTAIEEETPVGGEAAVNHATFAVQVLLIVAALALLFGARVGRKTSLLLGVVGVAAFLVRELVLYRNGRFNGV
ncbi:MAG TPA: hypothetical protein VGZ22_13100, partial [Isosphaeraceae bacterium]|nr:hypothetical protein [Isosphaeraceae bacterium]